MITLYEHCVVLGCDCPDCKRNIVAFGGGEARLTAKTCGWRELDRPMHVDNWWLCPDHRKYKPQEPVAENA